MIPKSIDEIPVSLHPLENYQHIYSLNNYTLPYDKNTYDKNTYDKYMPLSRVCKNSVTFVSPSSWEDTFETRYYKADYHNIGFSEPDIYCLCLTSKQATNEAAMWKMYAQAGEEMVKVRFNINNLLDSLESAAKQYGFDVYMGEVMYISAEEIRKKITQSNLKFFPKHTAFSLVHYLTLMSLKRLAFSFENEVRIFIVPAENCRCELPANRLPINCVNHISDVRVSPYPVLQESFPKSDGEGAQKVKQINALNALMMDKRRVQISHLYDKCPKVAIK